jgi:hypothetical protein
VTVVAADLVQKLLKTAAVPNETGGPPRHSAKHPVVLALSQCEPEERKLGDAILRADKP